MSTELRNLDLVAIEEDMSFFLKKLKKEYQSGTPSKEFADYYAEMQAESTYIKRLLKSANAQEYEFVRQYIRLWLERSKRDYKYGNRVKPEEIAKNEYYYLYMEQEHHKARLEIAADIIKQVVARSDSEYPLVVEVAAGVAKFGKYLQEVEAELQDEGYTTEKIIYMPTDISVEALEQAPADLPRTLASAEFLPFADESVDVVYAGELIEHLPPELLLKFFAEAQRVLKPTGQILLTTPNFHSLPAWWELDSGNFPRAVDERRMWQDGNSAWAIEHTTPFTHTSLREVLEKSGFTISTVTTNQITLNIAVDPNTGELYPNEVIRFGKHDQPDEEQKTIGDSLIISAQKKLKKKR